MGIIVLRQLRKSRKAWLPFGFSSLHGAGCAQRARVLRSTVSFIGLAVVIITTLAPPVGFLLVGVYYERQFSKTLAEASAANIASRFNTDPSYTWAAMAWRRSGHKARDAHGGDGIERVLDERGVIVWSAGIAPSAPRMTTTALVLARGKTLGTVEVVTSLQPLLLFTALIALLSSLLGYLAHLAVRAFPLRVLDDTLSALEERNWQLDGALTNVPIGISMFDSGSRLVVCNDRYREIFELGDANDLIGMTADRLNQIKIPSTVFTSDFESINKKTSGTDFGSGEMTLQKLANGRIIATTTQHASGGRIINVHQDITLLEDMHAALAKQRDDLEAKNTQLNIALANMAQGLSMFDRDQRLIVANKRYAEIYGFSPDMIEPGTHIEEFIKRRVESGDFSGEGAEAQLAERLANVQRGNTSVWFHDFPDGRRVNIRYVPLPEGGWVSTHEDVTEATRKEAKIVHMAQHDALTGLYNRYTLADRLKDAFSRCHWGHRFALLAIDLDYFKSVNDRHGHAVGDKLLSEVGNRLKALTRETDIVARLGGDEFAVLQSDIWTAQDALVLAQRIINGLSEPFSIEGHAITVGASIGIALAPADGEASGRLMDNCDLALYRAKELGRNTFSFFEPALELKVKERLALQQDLAHALRNSELELHFQPLVSLQGGDIAGVEALLRWRHPERGMIAPSDFIPLAEETGLIVPIGAWALQEACTTVAAWPGNLKVAVNLSAVQFRREELPKFIKKALQTSQLAPERLELEITESLLLDTNGTVRQALDQLHDLGVSIALDDFGTGYSSLSYLQSFPFDKIKIDRSFIRNCGTDQRSIDIVRSIVGMAKALDMVVVAEGVETAEQRDIAGSCGCDQFQGYLYSKPRPAREIAAMLAGPKLAAEAAA